MTVQQMRELELTEYEPTRLDVKQLPRDLGTVLWERHRDKINVEFPSPKTDGLWELTAQGWVGYVPVAHEFSIRILPRAPLHNLFRMLEYAYNLRSCRFFDDLYQCDSLDDLFSRLAKLLALRILDRTRRGLYRTYVPEHEQMAYIRGRIDVLKAARTPWEPRLTCDYHEHTADIEDNQLLAWTLSTVARTAICDEEVLPIVGRAYRSVRSRVTLRPFLPHECVGRLYTRLNEDYHVMHALCRFFLEHTGPRHESGDRTMLPFLVNMPRLYERFVAEWLKAHASNHWDIRAQETVHIGDSDSLSFNIDIVLRDPRTRQPMCVLDTKYKTPAQPAQSDVEQVVTYATLRRCTDAVLVYPTPLGTNFHVQIGGVHVRALTFALDDDLEQSGERFRNRLASLLNAQLEVTD